jgi:hypothetical protein
MRLVKNLFSFGLTKQRNTSRQLEAGVPNGNSASALCPLATMFIEIDNVPEYIK